ncbi:MAG: dihydroxyacetone kinase subunit DhaK [Selenomonas sp.]|uniref:dihydroxyacetone kinase subunit DhaK n=1 Tax=Selenomonas sp. TaxID=2053611 RepID=UPI0025FE7B6B|nr:dihydroxyacetone kinase subunit DhaK [Selenomonas sp.]MCR5756912.1 dihydroxyacetone kinase subunit DhaK [Selenomonas sp.]
MKKFINEPENLEAEVTRGLVLSQPGILRQLPDSNVIVRQKLKTDRVSVVFGCGSGHEPAPSGFVGYGMLDAGIPGKIFSSPTPDMILKGIKEVQNQAGVLCLIANYTGDVLNFRMAMDLAQMENIPVESVIIADDVATLKNKSVGRRGLAGVVLVMKIAGAEAELGSDLYRVKEIAEWAASGLRTIGVASRPCVIPADGDPSFELGEQEMEIGMGLHGEPGVLRCNMMGARETVQQMLEMILLDCNYEKSEVVVLINGLGGTPPMELYAVNECVHQYLQEQDIVIHDTMIGNYMTSMEMGGFSISLMRLDPHLKALYDAAAVTPIIRR